MVTEFGGEKSKTHNNFNESTRVLMFTDFCRSRFSEIANGVQFIRSFSQLGSVHYNTIWTILCQDTLKFKSATYSQSFLEIISLLSKLVQFIHLLENLCTFSRSERHSPTF